MTGTEKKTETEQKPRQEAAAASPVVLRFNNVAFSYRTGPVLENASFHIHRGEFIALVGQNGAGKTTVLKLILGLEKPSGGSIEIFGKNPSAARQKIGYVPQHADYDQTFPISVMEVVRMGRLQVTSRRYNQDDIIAVKNAMEQTEIADLAHRPYSALSGGQRRRVLVARALAANPELLILDEPSANMDIESEGRLFNTLGGLKGKTTILVVTHDSVFVSALTDRVLCVGGRSRLNGKGHSIAQHRAAPAENAPPDLYGGEVYKVLHDEDLPGDSCCIENREAK